ncbi:hypothetical protein BS47DRAFT_764786 [Hydnum rufescens UP504]|uniref:Uncharacterized protein n=1 Tax=Hydnum rufescens UP504 TaxID=1448309 RepID=A0A9P6E2K8_9AGAM|nr:hypothetical protein BS47DRAFT_764786 [Hydnum rufescens UP504]
MLFDDTSVSFVGRWAYHLDPLITNKFHSFHGTNHSGDFASLNFTGTSVDVFGIGGPHNGQYNVTLDGQTSTHDGQIAAEQVLLFSQQGG